VRVEIGLSGDKQVSRQLLRFGDRALAARPAFEAIGQMLLELEGQQFASEGHRASGGWEPLADSTLEHKHGPSILDETGELRASLTERGGPHQIWDVGDEFLLFGTDVDYASFHQTGTSRMPRRRPLELTEADRAGAVKILQRYIMTGVI
jgi:phage gpG-like protein